MRACIDHDAKDSAKTLPSLSDFAGLVSQVRLAVIIGVDEEFLADESLKALEVTAAQFAILKNVLKGSAKSACELCKSMDYDRGAMSRMIDRMEAKGLIRRAPLAHTRRTVALEVTDEGRAAFPKMQACLDRVVGRLMRGVTKAELREMDRILRRMLSNA